MKKPHIHSEVIKAWADGAEIEARACRSLAENKWSGWCTVEKPEWHPHQEYRIKQQPKPDLTLFYFVSDHVVQCSSKIHIHNLALTFDGTTGVLKSAEVV